MEAFEHVVKVFLEDERYIVTSGVKFPIARPIQKKSGRKETQIHGYEVDLVGAKHDSLLLGSVKSYFGSAGVKRQGFPGIADSNKRTHFERYTMFHNTSVREGILQGASSRYGYPVERIRMALFVGKFHRPDETLVRDHLNAIVLPGGPIQVVGLVEIVDRLRDVSSRKTYINDPVVMTLKVLRAAGLLREQEPVKAPDESELDEIQNGEVDDE
jgi:hypothetical protein